MPSDIKLPANSKNQSSLAKTLFGLLAAAFVPTAGAYYIRNNGQLFRGKNVSSDVGSDKFDPFFSLEQRLKNLLESMNQSTLIEFIENFDQRFGENASHATKELLNSIAKLGLNELVEELVLLSNQEVNDTLKNEWEQRISNTYGNRVHDWCTKVRPLIEKTIDYNALNSTEEFSGAQLLETLNKVSESFAKINEAFNSTVVKA